MTDIIYGDILFIVNFSMDFLALYVTGRILHLKLHTLSLVLSASLGALYGVIIIFCNGNRIMTSVINVCVSLLMCYVAYSFKDLLDFIKNVMLFYSINFILGGGITALYNLINSYKASHKIYVNGDVTSLNSSIPFGWFILLAAVSALISLVYGRIINKTCRQKSADINVFNNGISVNFKALCDSGNLLCEPLSGKPVIVTSTDIFNQLSGGNFSIHNTDIKLMRRIRVIPVNTVGHNGVIYGFIPDLVTVNGLPVDACLASDSGGDYAGYDAVLPAALIN